MHLGEPTSRIPCAIAGRILRAIAGLLLLLAPSLARAAGAPAAGDPPTVCVLRAPDASVEGIDLAAALVVEQRKAGLDVHWDLRASPVPCPRPPAGPAWVLRIDAGQAVLTRDGRGVMELPLDRLPSLDRPQELARRTLAALVATGDATPFPLGDGNVPLRVSVQAAGAPARRATAGYLFLGGRYAWQPGPHLHVAGPELEAGASWFGERLALGLRVAFLPRRPLAGSDVPADVQSLPLLAVLHGGLRVRPLLLRAALGVGAEVRQVRARPPTLRGGRQDWGAVAMVEGEVEALVPLGRSLRLSVAGIVQAYPGATRYRWNDWTVYDPPRVGVGACLRIGSTLAGGRP